MADLAQLPEQTRQGALVEFGQLGEAVVGDQIRQFPGLARVRLAVHGHLVKPEEQGGLRAPMAADDNGLRQGKVTSARRSRASMHVQEGPGRGGGRLTSRRQPRKPARAPLSPGQ